MNIPGEHWDWIGCECETGPSYPNDEGLCGNPVVVKITFDSGEQIYMCEACSDRAIRNYEESEYEQERSMRNDELLDQNYEERIVD